MQSNFEFRICDSNFVYLNGVASVSGTIDFVNAIYVIDNAKHCTYQDFRVINDLFLYYFGRQI